MSRQGVNYAVAGPGQGVLLSLLHCFGSLEALIAPTEVYRKFTGHFINFLVKFLHKDEHLDAFSCTSLAHHLALHALDQL